MLGIGVKNVHTLKRSILGSVYRSFHSKVESIAKAGKTKFYSSSMSHTLSHRCLGIQYAGSHLQEVAKAFKNPTANLGLIFDEASKRAFKKVGLASVPSLDSHVHPSLRPAAAKAAKVIPCLS